jgi:hypothetical protein
MSGSFNADRLETSHVLQPFAGISRHERQAVYYNNV